MIDTPLRRRINLSGDWRFQKGRVSRRWLKFKHDKGELISLPHTWNTRDTFQYGRMSSTGTGAYQRSFAVPAGSNSGSWRLVSEGFYGIAELWIDGARHSVVDSQYLGFEILDLEEGEHLLSIRLDNKKRKNVLPGSSEPDFILHGGLAGRIFLEHTPAVSFAKRTAAIEWRLTPTPQVQICWNLNHQQPAPGEVDIEWRLVDLDGHCLAEAPVQRIFSPDALSSHKPDALSSDKNVAVMTAPQALSWSPDTPNLYWAEGRIRSGGKELDVIRIRFGFVNAEFRQNEGFFVNGKRLELHGCNRHEAMPGFGSALLPSMHRWDAEILKDVGCNFVRLSHYPQHPLFLDACDELGLFVYSEIATWKSVRSARSFRSSARRQMRDLILRDRHRPSPILWGMGNESRSRKTYLELALISHELDPLRATIYAENHLYRARRQKTAGIPDVWGNNYEIDLLKETSVSSRSGTVVLSECCNHPSSVRGDDHEELTQIGVLECEWEKMEDRPYLAGYAVWCFADYATEHRQRFRRLNGLFDAWRQPKMAAELFRARHAIAPCLSIFVTGKGPPAPGTRYRKDIRSAGSPGREVHIFSNCSRIQVQLGDQKTLDLEGALHYVLDLSGHRHIDAHGILEDRRVEASWRAPGAAIKLVIDNDETGPQKINTLIISAVDGEGLVDPNVNTQIKLSSDGPATLHAYTEATEVEMTRGTGRLMLTINRERGRISLIASAEGVEDGRWTQTT